MRAPDSWSCPEEASASQEGFLFLWAVLFICLALEGYPVLFCVSSPGGLLIPPDVPREILGGARKGSGCRGRAEGTDATATRTNCHGLQSSQLCHGLHCLFHSGGPRPVFLCFKIWYIVYLLIIYGKFFIHNCKCAVKKANFTNFII